jgi:prepilin-type N-terminal cleavage/methylation domain-containing protein
MNKIKLQSQRGFSLMEIMVSLVIGMLILAGILYVYLGNFASFRWNSQMARLQEDGRFAMSLLEDDLRMAAYAGCTRTGLDFLDLGSPSSGPMDLSEINITIDANAATKAGFNSKNKLVQGLAWEASGGLKIFGIPKKGSGAWLISRTDCDGTEIKGAKSSDPDVAIQLEIGARVYKLNGSTLSLDGKPLVENVNNFRVCAGVDANMDEVIDEWKSSVAMTDDLWIKTTAVQVDLVLSSAEDVLDTATSPSFTLCDGSTAAPSSSRQLRKHFHNTIVLRNKVPNGYGKDLSGDDASRAAAAS